MGCKMGYNRIVRLSYIRRGINLLDFSRIQYYVEIWGFLNEKCTRYNKRIKRSRKTW